MRAKLLPSDSYTLKAYGDEPTPLIIHANLLWAHHKRCGLHEDGGWRAEVDRRFIEATAEIVAKIDEIQKATAMAVA